MRDRGRWMPASAVAALVITTGLLSGCSASASPSRHKLYESIDALAADSSAIVVGTVTAQSAADGTTISSGEVVNAPTNPQLGGNLTERPEPAAVGATVEVRQDAPPLLEVGDEYLLFLTPTMLTGDAATQYFITGAVAGLYARDGDGFRRVVPDSGDILPDTINAVGG